MIYHLCSYFKELLTYVGFYAWDDVLFRAILAAITAFAIAVLMAPRTIRWLMRMKIGDRPEFHHAALNELMRERANTPTMGGILIIGATLASVLLWADLTNPYIWLLIFVTVGFGCIGFWDDYLKLIKKNNRGLSGRGKLLGQLAVADAGSLHRDDVAGDLGYLPVDPTHGSPPCDRRRRPASHPAARGSS